MAPFLFHEGCPYPTKAGRGGSAIGLSPTDASRATAGGDYTLRLFKPDVSSIVGEKLFPRNWTNCRMLSRAAAQGSLPWVRKTITKIAVPITSSVGTNPISHPLFALGKSMDPAPIDIVAFGRRLAEIISKAVRASRKRHKSRK